MRAATTFRIFAALEKVDKQDDGTLIVSGVASTESRDSAGELVKADAMRAAIPDYMAYGAVREMHQPIAAGTAITCGVDEGGITRLTAHIVDPTSILKVNTGVLKGFSIGGKIRQRNKLDKSIIEGIQLTEISLVDRPANPDARIDLVKVDASGTVKLLKALTDGGAVEPVKPSIRKGMYDIGILADLISTLSAMVMWTQDEANWEGDDSDVPARLNDAVVALVAVFREMVDEETSELLGISAALFDTPEAIIAAAEKCAALQKKGAKFSKATIAALSAVDTMLANGCATMKALNYTHADNSEEQDTMTEAEKVEFAKAQARVVELEAAAAAKDAAHAETLGKAIKIGEDATAAATAANDKLEKMAAQIGPLLQKVKGSVRAVPRSQDGNASTSEPLAKADSAAPSWADSIRASHSKPLSPAGTSLR